VRVIGGANVGPSTVRTLFNPLDLMQYLGFVGDNGTKAAAGIEKSDRVAVAVTDSNPGVQTLLWPASLVRAKLAVKRLRRKELAAGEVRDEKRKKEEEKDFKNRKAEINALADAADAADAEASAEASAEARAAQQSSASAAAYSKFDALVRAAAGEAIVREDGEEEAEDEQEEEEQDDAEAPTNGKRPKLGTSGVALVERAFRKFKL